MDKPTAALVMHGKTAKIHLTFPDGTTAEIGGKRAERASAVIVCRNLTRDELTTLAESGTVRTFHTRGGRQTLPWTWTVDERERAREALDRADAGRYTPGKWGFIGTRQDAGAAASEAALWSERVIDAVASVIRVERPVS
jgi:hypothetical protein